MPPHPNMPRRRLPVGISSFRKLRENGYYYADKSLFIEEVIKSPAEVLLLPRPRRFGKTLNLNMLRFFFDMDGDHAYLFDGLAIRQNPVLVRLSDRYHIRSNRESGLGRYGLMLKPKTPDRPGMIIEFKRADEKENPEKVLQKPCSRLTGWPMQPN